MTHLLASPINDLVNGRIRCGTALQGDDVPRITFTRVSEDPVATLKRVVGTVVRLQSDCWALKAEDAQQIRDQLREAIKFFRGNMGGLEVSPALPRNSRQVSERAKDGSDRIFYRAALEMSFTIKE